MPTDSDEGAGVSFLNGADSQPMRSASFLARRASFLVIRAVRVREMGAHELPTTSGTHAGNVLRGAIYSVERIAGLQAIAEQPNPSRGWDFF